MNEEMLTVNAELQAKIEELTLNQDDMRNLLQAPGYPFSFWTKTYKCGGSPRKQNSSYD